MNWALYLSALGALAWRGGELRPFSLLRNVFCIVYPCYSVSQHGLGQERWNQRDDLIKNLVSVTAGSAILDLDLSGMGTT